MQYSIFYAGADRMLAYRAMKEIKKRLWERPMLLQYVNRVFIQENPSCSFMVKVEMITHHSIMALSSTLLLMAYLAGALAEKPGLLDEKKPIKRDCGKQSSGEQPFPRLLESTPVAGSAWLSRIVSICLEALCHAAIGFSPKQGLCAEVCGIDDEIVGAINDPVGDEKQKTD
jgi:hypothetical protein